APRTAIYHRCPSCGRRPSRARARPSGTQGKNLKVVSNFFLAVRRPQRPRNRGQRDRRCGGSQLGKESTMSTQKPTLIAYAVKQRDKGKKAIWTRIGAAWPHDKGKGFSIELEALPLDGRVV